MKRILVMLCAVALVLNANAQEVSATYDPDVDGDNNIGVTDLLALLSLFSENDLDDDGIWDSQDDCVGEYDECGICNGPGPQILGIDTIIVYYDSLYAEAIDEWWVFEVDADTLLTYLCENPGCMDPTADNYDPYAVEEDGSCLYSNGSPVCDFQTAVHYDGFTYDLVAIGNQCWFAENLRTEHYANGDAILGELSDVEWLDAWINSNGATAVYGEGASGADGSDYLQDYGRLYNWHAVDDSRGLCPSGWHVPSDEEFMILEMELGMSEFDANTENNVRGTDQGTQMKSAPQGVPSWDGTNISGFSALPGGMRDYEGYFAWEGDHTQFWSATTHFNEWGDEEGAWFRSLWSASPYVVRGGLEKGYGSSVRCVRD